MVYGLYQRLLKDKDLVDFDDVLFLVRLTHDCCSSAVHSCLPAYPYAQIIAGSQLRMRSLGL